MAYAMFSWNFWAIISSWKTVAFHLVKFEFPVLKDALCQSLVETEDFLNSINAFALCHYFLP